MRWPIEPHPDWTVALQVFASNTDQPFSAPIVVTYTVWVAWSTSMSSGVAPTSTLGGAVVGHAVRWVALQVALSIIETVMLSPEKSSEFATYTVWLAGSAKSWIGRDPTGTCRGRLAAAR